MSYCEKKEIDLLPFCIRLFESNSCKCSRDSPYLVREKIVLAYIELAEAAKLALNNQFECSFSKHVTNAIVICLQLSSRDCRSEEYLVDVRGVLCGGHPRNKTVAFLDLLPIFDQLWHCTTYDHAGKVFFKQSHAMAKMLYCLGYNVEELLESRISEIT